jgi:hypothetical protein
MRFQEKKSPIASAWENRVVLPKSPDTPVYAKSPLALSKTRLKLISQRKNESLDDAQWLAQLGVSDAILRTIPAWMSPKLNGIPATGYIPENDAPGIAANAKLPPERAGSAVATGQGDNDRVRVGLYGKEAWEPRYLIRLDEESPEAMLGPCLDFGAWQRGGRFTPLVYVHALYREVFVSTAINGYAREVGGKTGYLSVLNWNSGKLMWHAGPRIANARNFAVVKDVVICGYGFTQEPDALYVLDVTTGRTVQTIPLASAPELIYEKDNKIHVRCYDTDYVFRLQ